MPIEAGGLLVNGERDDSPGPDNIGGGQAPSQGVSRRSLVLCRDTVRRSPGGQSTATAPARAFPAGAWRSAGRCAAPWRWKWRNTPRCSSGHRRRKRHRSGPTDLRWPGRDCAATHPAKRACRCGSLSGRGLTASAREATPARSRRSPASPYQRSQAALRFIRAFNGVLGLPGTSSSARKASCALGSRKKAR